MRGQTTAAPVYPLDYLRDGKFHGVKSIRHTRIPRDRISLQSFDPLPTNFGLSIQDTFVEGRIQTCIEVEACIEKLGELYLLLLYLFIYEMCTCFKRVDSAFSR
ncbi:hypothetical protein KM043_008542 [Ampulex compressa]|nr:hypothetical protein KM043_008542 [Ampulex compressa]